MITVDLQACTGCGACLRRFEGYCVTGKNGRPQIDYSLCNQCQKCVAICPSQAFLTSGIKPLKLEGPAPVLPDSLEKLLTQRKFVKKYKKEKVPREILQKIAEMAAYAPNQNKNIDIVIVYEPGLIEQVDSEALRFISNLYEKLIKPLAFLFERFSGPLHVTKKKMEYDLFYSRHIVKENTGALFLAVGNPRVPVTEESAQYLLGTMTIYAQAMGIGTCLMDSLKMSINRSRHIKKEIGIPQNSKVLGVLAAGYSNENFINIPQGYAINIYWNRMNK